MNHYDVLVIGGGAGGMAAALSALENGYRKILIAERKESLGGILLQCTHKGFGLGYFGEDLSGLEYAERFQLKVQRTEIQVRCNTMVLRLYPNQTALLSGTDGIEKVAFDVCVLATGCRERTLYSQEISGPRPAGIMTAGTAQKLMNVDGLEIGDEIIIAGTGDVGQIMAGQLSLSGKRIIAMIEKEDHPGGLKRNQENYLKALHIPVILNSVITRVHGRKRIEGVEIRNLLTGELSSLKCSTLLTAIGMISETDLLKTSFGKEAIPDWLIKVGNCKYVHEIVDSVTADGLQLWDMFKRRPHSRTWNCENR